MINQDFSKLPELPKHPKFIQIYATVVLITLGFAVIVCALFIPPKGEIHPSVLAAFGMTLCFAGSYLGMDFNNKSKYYNILKLLTEHNAVVSAPRKRKTKAAKNDESQSE